MAVFSVLLAHAGSAREYLFTGCFRCQIPSVTLFPPNAQSGTEAVFRK